jgi:hypothetical protein
MLDYIRIRGHGWVFGGVWIEDGGRPLYVSDCVISHHNTKSRTRHQAWFRFLQEYAGGKPSAKRAMALIREHNWPHYLELMARYRPKKSLRS